MVKKTKKVVPKPKAKAKPKAAPKAKTVERGSLPLKTKRKEQFCLEHVANLNASECARDAGYSHKTANRIANALLTNIDIQDRLSYLKKQNIKRVKNSTELELSADRVLEEVARLAFSNINNFMEFTKDGYAYIDMSKATPQQLAAVSSLEVIDMPPMTLMGTDGQKLERQVLKVKFKMWDKSKNLENLMKHFGLIKEKVEIEGLDKMIQQLQKGRDRVAANRNKD